MDEAAILSRLRRICLALPNSTESVSFGHPVFRTSGKIYAALETYRGELSICFKVGKQIQGVFLEDARFYKTPYVGQHGWVSLRAHAAALDWEELGELLRGSHELIGTPVKRPK
jgi:predicted DNA-binding protein (MmcQ/YjbR family)